MEGVGWWKESEEWCFNLVYFYLVLAIWFVSFTSPEGPSGHVDLLLIMLTTQDDEGGSDVFWMTKNKKSNYVYNSYMLGKEAILQAIKDGELGIEPWEEGLLEEASYGIRLGRELRVVKKGAVVDLRKEEFLFDSIKMDEEGYVLKPGQFVLGTTMEVVTLSDKIGAWLDGRMKLARYGVSVHQASSFCDPGRSNAFTLEIFNAGQNSFVLYPGLRVGALVFERVN